jgi:hypothetical protein
MKTLESSVFSGVLVGVDEVRLVPPTALLAAAVPTGLLTGLMLMGCFL